MTKNRHYELEKRVAERPVELAGAREKSQAVLGAATHVSIIATDTHGLITVFNHGAEQMLGYASDEMVGKQSPAIIHLESEVLAQGSGADRGNRQAGARLRCLCREGP